MKSVFSIVIALAYSCQAHYPESIVPALVRGVPEVSESIISVPSIELVKSTQFSYDYSVPHAPVPTVPAQIYGPPAISVPEVISPLELSYGYSVSHISAPALAPAQIYGPPEILTPDVYSPLPEFPVGQAEIYEPPAIPAPIYIVPEEDVKPVAISYEYEAPQHIPDQVLVQEIVEPAVPHSTYGLLY